MATTLDSALGDGLFWDIGINDALSMLLEEPGAAGAALNACGLPGSNPIDPSPSAGSPHADPPAEQVEFGVWQQQPSVVGWGDAQAAGWRAPPPPARVITTTIASPLGSYSAGGSSSAGTTAHAGSVSDKAGSGEMTAAMMEALTSHNEPCSWQDILGSIDPAAAAMTGRAVSGSSASGGTGRHRQGVLKPCKDKKRENAVRIRELEAELAQKLSLVRALEGQNDDLKHKERVLKISVNTTEQNISQIINPQLAPNLRKLLLSFRGICNRASAEGLLSRTAHVKEGKDLTIDMFRSTWMAFVGELGDVLMAESTATSLDQVADIARHLQDVTQRVGDFAMSVCVSNMETICRAQSIDLATGEPAYRDMEFWGGVADRLDLSPDQVKDMVGAFQTFGFHILQNMKARSQIKAELDTCLAAHTSNSGWKCGSYCQTDSGVMEAMQRLVANMTRCDVLHTMLSFVALRILTPKQVAQLCMHASPMFPNLHVMAMAVSIKAGCRVDAFFLHPPHDAEQEMAHYMGRTATLPLPGGGSSQAAVLAGGRSLSQVDAGVAAPGAHRLGLLQDVPWPAGVPSHWRQQ